jgi:hypothetical protein
LASPPIGLGSDRTGIGDVGSSGSAGSFAVTALLEAAQLDGGRVRRLVRLLLPQGPRRRAPANSIDGAESALMQEVRVIFREI